MQRLTGHRKRAQENRGPLAIDPQESNNKDDRRFFVPPKPRPALRWPTLSSLGIRTKSFVFLSN